MPVNATHPDYDANAAAWSRARDVVVGEEAVKAAGERYLPRLDSQTVDEYAAYKQQASFFNATSRTAGAYLGLIFRRPPFVKLPAEDSGLGRALSEFKNDADVLGLRLWSATRKMLSGRSLRSVAPRHLLIGKASWKTACTLHFTRRKTP